MKLSSHSYPWLRLMALTFICVAGVVTIIATNGDGGEDACLEMGAACSEASECCDRAECEDGRCCQPVGRTLDSDETADICCTGQSVATGYSPVCCATEGMVVGNANHCCGGLDRNNSTGACTSCASPCYWRDEPTVYGMARECICPNGSNGVDVVTPPCSPCSDPSDENCHAWLAYNEGYDPRDPLSGLGLECRVLPSFYAESDEDAEMCARIYASEVLSASPRIVVEEYDWPDPDPCVRVEP